MKNRFVLTPILLMALSISALSQQRNSLAAVGNSRASSLQDLVNEAAHTALTKFADKKLTESQLSITLIDLRDLQHPAMASLAFLSGGGPSLAGRQEDSVNRRDEARSARHDCRFIKRSDAVCR